MKKMSFVVSLLMCGAGLLACAGGALAAGPVTTRFAVSGDVLRPGTYDLADLKALPAVTLAVGAHDYTGVDLWGFLDTTVGLALRPGVKNDVLGMAVIATGSDGYKAVLSLGELADAFGNQPDLIAYAMDGVDLVDAGFARIVVPGDVKAGRWVSNLTGIEVVHVSSPVPELDGWAMWVIGLAAGGVLARRRKATGSGHPIGG